jgi:SAM-dependent methyltransferase
MRFRSRAPYVASIGLSAYLLFSLELLAGRLVLPVFGGAPAVWTTALCFFTAVVFLGYLYAHLIVTRLGRRRGSIVHLALVVAVLVATMLAPADLGALRYPGMPEALNVLLVLALVAGAPAFLLSTTSPLLSAWIAERGDDPWWLYAVSNAASLFGLIAYPFLIEPTIPLSGQRSILIALLAVVAVGLTVVVVGARRIPDVVREKVEAVTEPPTRRRKALWLLAACVPAGLLAATTTYLTTDHISAPLLWIGPLGIYLASFVVAFSERGRRILPVVERLVPAAATLLWVPYVVPTIWPVVVILPLTLASYGVLAVAIHGRLALDRPDAAHLTGFYLVLSAGGMVATALVALVAPTVFSDVYEYPILLVAGLAALSLLSDAETAGTRTRRGSYLREAAARLLPYLLVGAVLVAFAWRESAAAAVLVAVLVCLGAVLVAMARTMRLLAVGTLLSLVAMTALFAQQDIARVRTFFGVITVRPAVGGAARSEMNGTTLHGLQFLDARSKQPTSYYVRSGPLGDAMLDLDRRLPGGAAIGTVGLGIGTLASYARAGDSMTFFEIDQAIVDLARDPRYFTYLADAAILPRIVMGDGRLSLAEEPAASLDLLVLDAFSSDSVPVHLLTREAMQLYERTLRPGGILLFHLSNRNFDLVPAVGSTARSLGLSAAVRSYTPDTRAIGESAAAASIWMVVGTPADVARFEGIGWTAPADGPVLTDDFSDIVRLLRFR